MIGKIARLLHFHIAFFKVIFTVNIIYPILKKYANKPLFSQIHPAPKTAKPAMGNFHLPHTIKIIARATNNHPQEPS